jgi:hypothetical protein
MVDELGRELSVHARYPHSLELQHH